VATLDKWKRGQRIISANQENRRIDNARVIDGISFSADFQTFKSPSGLQVALNVQDKDPFYRIRRSTSNAVKCLSASLMWNGHMISTSDTTLTLGAVSTSYGIYISTSNTSGTRDRNIKPNKAKYNIATMASLTVATAYNANDNRIIIGKAYTDSKRKIRKIETTRPDFINKHLFVFDGESNSATAPVRKTLQYNTSNNIHKKEVQLQGVGSVPASRYRVPFFPASSSGTGTLTWGSMDSDYGTSATSTQFSLERRVTSSGSWFQMKDFHLNTDVQMTSSDLVFYKDVSANRLRKSTLASFYGTSDFGNAIIGIIGSSGPFWVQGDVGTATCYGQSIGNESKQIVVDLVNQTLDRENTEQSIDWNAWNMYEDGGSNISVAWNSKTLASSGKTRMNWNQALLYDLTPAISANWRSRILVSSSGGTTVDWEGRNLKGSAGGNSYNWETLNFIGNHVLTGTFSATGTINSNTNYLASGIPGVTDTLNGFVQGIMTNNRGLPGGDAFTAGVENILAGYGLI